MRTPQNIRVHKERSVLEIVWSHKEVSMLPFQTLRQNCRCAACVDEFTGRQLLDQSSVPSTIQPEDVSLVGNYAIKFRWSDGHDSGLFTFSHLSDIAGLQSQQAD